MNVPTPRAQLSYGSQQVQDSLRGVQSAEVSYAQGTSWSIRRVGRHTAFRKKKVYPAPKKIDLGPVKPGADEGCLFHGGHHEDPVGRGQQAPESPCDGLTANV
jgi:hypothetical protein